MKAFTVVGVRKSGKTTVVTELVSAFKKMGLRVGTSKTVFCPSFSIDKKGTNTWKHKDAGADFVCVKAKGETDLLMQGGNEQKLYQMLSKEADILILEGDYELLVPRVVCAHKISEAEERWNECALLLSGRIAESMEAYNGNPVFNVLTQAEEMAKWLWEQLPEVKFPVATGNAPGSVSSFCQCGCHKAEKQQKKKEEEIPDDILPKENVEHAGMHVFLTGEKGVGKSTLLKKLRMRLQKEFDFQEVGFETRKFQTEGQDRGFYMHSLASKNEFENDFPVTIRVGEKKILPVTDSFETLGVSLLREARELKANLKIVLVADEIGKAENKAKNFQAEMIRCLNEMPLVIGILQKCNGILAAEIANRTDVLLYEVTETNRDHLEEKLMQMICSGRNVG